MDLEQIQQAIGGPNPQPAKPDGPSEVQPLNQGGLDKTAAEPFPQNVNAQQGAGSPGSSLTPAPGEPAGGRIHVGGNRPDSSTGPEQRPTLSGIASLTAGQINRPEDGTVPSGEPPGAATDPRLGGDQTGQQINPALKAALAPRPGPFGPPSSI